MTQIWRFFAGEDTRWRWQQLSIDRAVLLESRTSYANYEKCVEAARISGYVFEAAQAPLAPRKRQAYQAYQEWNR